jgi:hypothetical protein
VSAVEECQGCRDAAGEIARREGVDEETAYLILHRVVHHKPSPSRSQLRRISVTSEGGEIEVRGG